VGPSSPLPGREAGEQALDLAGEVERSMDRQLPRFQARTFSAVVVDAGTERTYQAVRALDPDQVGQAVPFMRLMARRRS
jgi:hypothetical protein